MAIFNVTVQSGSQPSEADFTGMMAAVPQAAEETHIAMLDVTCLRWPVCRMPSTLPPPSLHSLLPFILSFLFFQSELVSFLST